MGPVVPVVEEAKPVLRERLFCCEHFGLSRIRRRIRQFIGRRCGNAARAGVHRRRRPVGARGRRLCRRQRRRFPLAGRGRSVLLPDARRDHVVGHFAAGRKRQEMKKLIVFDLDGTLAESKASIDAEMAALLHDLLGFVKVAVISGGNWPQFEKQVLANLPHDERLRNLSLLPTCGTKFYRYAGDWKKTLFRRFHRGGKRKNHRLSRTSRSQQRAARSKRSGERSLKTGEARSRSPH